MLAMAWVLPPTEPRRVTQRECPRDPRTASVPSVAVVLSSVSALVNWLGPCCQLLAVHVSAGAQRAPALCRAQLLTFPPVRNHAKWPGVTKSPASSSDAHASRCPKEVEQTGSGRTRDLPLRSAPRCHSLPALLLQSTQSGGTLSTLVLRHSVVFGTRGSHTQWYSVVLS